jgi:hypothetical protein
MLTLRMSGTILPLPLVLSWHAQELLELRRWVGEMLAPCYRSVPITRPKRGRYVVG